MGMDKETGISIMKIVPKLDAGPYMLQKIIIDAKDNFVSLSNKLSEIGSSLIIEALSLFENKKIKFIDQTRRLRLTQKN